MRFKIFTAETNLELYNVDIKTILFLLQYSHAAINLPNLVPGLKLRVCTITKQTIMSEVVTIDYPGESANETQN